MSCPGFAAEVVNDLPCGSVPLLILVANPLAELLLSLDMSCRPFWMKVSQSRTGQEMGILKLAPRFVSKRQGQLIEG